MKIQYFRTELKRLNATIIDAAVKPEKGKLEQQLINGTSLLTF